MRIKMLTKIPASIQLHRRSPPKLSEAKKKIFHGPYIW